MATVRYTTIQGEILTEKRAGVRRLYVPDPLGSTVALLDNTQTKTDTFSYWPYGEESARTGSTPTPFRFVGTKGYYRDKIERVYVRARHLRTDQARWLTVDPIGFGGGNVNLHVYVHGQPTLYIDPTGLLQQGIDYCGSKSNRKPIGRCPDGGTAVCVTCYGSDAEGGEHISYRKECGGDRPPQLGDCSVDNRGKKGIQQCQGGDFISFADFGNGNPVGTGLPRGMCRACDGGQGHSGVDVYVGGKDKYCDDALKQLGFPNGTNWYCIQCNPALNLPIFGPIPSCPPRRRNH